MNNNRNMFLAIGLSMLVIIGWSFLLQRYAPPPPPKPAIAQAVQMAAAEARATKVKDRVAALAESPRVVIETPTLKGSLNLKGARIDDLILVKYAQDVAKNSPPVILYAPNGTETSALAGFGWAGQGVALPTPETLWVADSAKLTPETPLSLHWDNGAGQIFGLKITVDKSYMFTVTQSVGNKGTGAVSVAPYSYVSRNNAAIDKASVAHVGPIGSFNDRVDYDLDYTNLDGQEASFFGRMFGSTAKPGVNTFTTTGGWLGFGDKYWLSAVIPAQNAAINAEFRKDGNEYRAGYWSAPIAIAAGQTQSTVSHVFAGAKEVEVVDGYETTLGIPHFGKVIDWGWFEVICKPLFWIIHKLFQLTGNFGVAIIMTTFIIRGILFPVAQMQFASMASMRVAQPKIKALQERFKDDKLQLQQETMKLYKEEKVNPLGGCLPALMPIPVFFALYKVLSVSIEMRHQPFVLWIHDLSVPDPLLFGQFPGIAAYIPNFLAIGILPIILGISLWLIQKASPPPPDPAQAQMMALMPWMMVFFFSSMAAGLQVYYIVSNTLTILQQRWFFARHPVLKQPMVK